MQRVWKHFVGAVDLETKMLAVVIDTLALQQLENQRQRLLLEIAPAVEIDAEAVEFVFAVARAQAECEAAAEAVLAFGLQWTAVPILMRLVNAAR